jgi:hypothetical protein
VLIMFSERLSGSEAESIKQTYRIGSLVFFSVGALISTRIVSWLVKLLLIKVIMKGDRKLSACFAAIITLALFAFPTYILSDSVERIIVYAASLTLWLVVDLAFAAKAERSETELSSQAAVAEGE